MATKRQLHLDELFQAAESAGTHLVPATDADAAALRRRAKAGAISSPAPGIYARSSHLAALDPKQQALHLARALAHQHPRWVLASHTAALVHGIDVPWALLNPVQVFANTRRTVDAGSSVRIRHCHTIAPLEVETVDGLPVSTYWYAVLDSLLESPFQLGLAVADSAARQNRLDATHLAGLLRMIGARRKGIRCALFIASFADGRAESGGESRARAIMIQNGFPIPDLQHELPNVADPAHPYRVDNFWDLGDGRGLIGEFDGFEKYTNETMLQGKSTARTFFKERQRESRLTLLGYPVLRYSYQDIKYPHRLVNLLISAGLPQDMDAAFSWRRQWEACWPRGRTGTGNRRNPA